MNYNVDEIFYSIQGEGHHTGLAMLFIRLAGCNLTCHWCDVKSSWRVGRPIPLQDILRKVQESPAPGVCITGGEPFLQDLHPLIAGIKTDPIRPRWVHIETNGTCLPDYIRRSVGGGELRSLPYNPQWIVMSPKRQSPPPLDTYSRIDEVKVVVAKAEDLIMEYLPPHIWMTSHILSVQPEGNRPEAIKLCVDYVKEHPRWRLSLQMQKFINIR